MVRLLLLILVFASITAHTQAWAVEIHNLHLGQEGKRAYVQYDLTGKPGEKEANVRVSVTIDGESYSHDKLALSGDFGNKVKVGIGKRIWWDLLKDMPAGYDGEVSWALDAALPPEYLALIKEQKTVAESPKAERLQPPSVPLLKPDYPGATQAPQDSGLFKSFSHAVIDTRTGLMWAKLGDITTERFNYDRARSFIAKMNRDAFGGFADWRLPGDSDVARLFASAAIITSKTDKPAMKVLLSYFPNLEDWHYWQDAPNSRPLGRGWQYSRSFDIEDGAATADLKVDELCILPVRDVTGSAPKTGHRSDS